MDYKTICRKHYADRIRQKRDTDPELYRALRVQERVPQFVDKLAQEIAIVQHQMVLKRGKPFSEKQIQDVVYDMIDAFVFFFQQKARKAQMSDIERARLEAQANALNDIQQTLSGKPSGIYEEMGVKIHDSASEGQEKE